MKEKEIKREKKREKESKGEKKREKRCLGSIIINLHLILKNKE